MDDPSSSRAASPPPLDLASLPPARLDMDADLVSIPASSKRSDSYSSASTFSVPSSLPKTSTGFFKASPTVNRHTTCGRHTDQFIFGGPSLKDLARAIKRKF